MKQIALLFTLILCLSCAPDKPNIILIYADDLGIGLLSHEGQEIIKTPNIDQLASEGMRFNNAYSCMLCAPARASLITGQHDCHADGFEITNAGIYKKISTGEYSHDEVEARINKALKPIPEEQVFLGQVAQEAGYVTAQFGKLEWGFAATDMQMKRHGWDYYFGYLDHQRAHGFYPPFLFENGKLKKISGNTLINCGKTGEPETKDIYSERWDNEGKVIYSQDLFMEEVINFLRSNADKPFFLYFPTQLPHGPVAIPEIHPDYVDEPRLTPIEKEYASMVKMLDDNVGQIMMELENLGIAKNTMVIFTADNGHEIYYAQEGRVLKPYTNMITGERFDNHKNKYYSLEAGDVFDGNGGRAGMKRSNLQGGINVPLIIRWPENIQGGTTSNHLVANYDIMSTIAEITGFSGEINSDGISFLEELETGDSENQHEFLVYSSWTGPTLVTKEGWKIRTILSKDVFELYYLPDDFREEKDLSEKFPEKTLELKALLLEACDGDFLNGQYPGSHAVRVNH